jgi:signal transduction histidine kinase
MKGDISPAGVRAATALFCVAILSLTGWMIWQSRRAAEVTAYATTANLSQTLEQHAARTIETVDLTIRLVLQNLAASGTARADLQTLITEAVRGSPQVANLLVIDRTGHPVIDALGVSEGIEVTTRDYFVAHRDHPEIDLHVSRPFFSRKNQYLRLGVSRRISAPDGSFDGLVLATLRPEYFQAFYDGIDVGRNGTISIASTAGYLLVRKPFSQALLGRDFSAAPLFAKYLFQAAAGSFEAVSATDGVRRITSYRRVEGYPFVVQVALATDEVLADWRRLAAGSLAAALAFCALAIGLGLWLSRELIGRARSREVMQRSMIDLREANLAKSRFLANMSHELRTPLNAIIGFSEVLASAMFGPLDGRYQGYARDINSSGQHLLSLINDVLDIAKIEAGKYELRPEPLDLATLIAGVVRMEAQTIRHAGLTIETRIPPGAALIADRRAVTQMLLNLIANSVKFTPAGGAITISFQSHPPGDEIAVADTGIGMAEADIPKALTPFTQIDNSLSRKFGGTGLGLPLSHSFVQLHGGRMNVVSELGRGTVVTVTLPGSRIVSAVA